MPKLELISIAQFTISISFRCYTYANNGFRNSEFHLKRKCFVSLSKKCSDYFIRILNLGTFCFGFPIVFFYFTRVCSILTKYLCLFKLTITKRFLLAIDILHRITFKFHAQPTQPTINIELQEIMRSESKQQYNVI